MNHNQQQPSRPITKHAPETHRSPTLATECKNFCSKASLLLLSLNASEFLKLVKVPGMTRKPASKIQVNTAARMLCSLGIRSRCNSMSMYRVCVDGMRVSDGGRCSGSAELVRKGIPMTTSFVRVLEEVDSNEFAIRAGLRGSESSEGIGDRGAGA